MKRLEVQTLRGAGVTVEEVATHAAVSPRTVVRVAKEDLIDDPVAVDSDRSKRMGRPSKVAPYLELVEKWLTEDPKIPTNHVLERLRDEGYDGSKSAVYDAVKKLRKAAPPEGIVRFEGLPGEFSQHDFGEVWIRYKDGSRERIKFFASCLKYSRLRRVWLAPNEKTDSVCHGLYDAFAYFGGVPLMSVFDNPKTIVTSRDGDHVKWNDTFARFCAEAHIVPRATWPRRPQEKGAVENLVGYAKSSFFKVHVFDDRADMEARLEVWHVKVNDERVCRATGEIPRARFLLEQIRLRSLGIGAGGFRLRYTRIVRRDGFIEFDGLRYYVGMSNIGAEATLHVEKDDLEVWVARDRVATHPRQPVNGKYSVLPEQRGELIQKQGARPYLKRELMQHLCPAAEWYMTELRHRRPDHWEDQVARLYELLEEFEEAALRDAFIEAARREVVGAEYIEAILRGQAQTHEEASS
ncbi:MAG: IS21 family transposase [Deltaproteobacteria bacterium]|nr:IS21 family transposase [Deltaproteobacteria bacterium]MBW2667927.1 IS21 family transposase [Deltaproteobacteria bacterium]